MNKFCVVVSLSIIVAFYSSLSVDAQSRNIYSQSGNRVVIRQTTDPQLAFKLAKERWEHEGVTNGYISHNNNHIHNPNSNRRQNTNNGNPSVLIISQKKRKPVKPSFGYWG